MVALVSWCSEVTCVVVQVVGAARRARNGLMKGLRPLWLVLLPSRPDLSECVERVLSVLSVSSVCVSLVRVLKGTAPYLVLVCWLDGVLLLVCV